MRHKILWFLLFSGWVLVIAGVFLLVPTPQTVEASPIVAQCGSQASSCKTCHEVQAQKPVNNDGTGWHESHAFGDFCVFCHAGNDQSTDKVASHTGMVAPLSDVKTACQQCHTDDLMERAQVYATILNVKLDSSGSSPVQSAPTNTPAAAVSEVQATQPPAAVQPTAQQVVSNAPVNNEVVVNDPNTIDYVQRYNEIVLGQRPVNWGNIVLIALIAIVIVGGGGFVMLNEMRLRLASPKLATAEGQYPADVVEMLPALARLKLQTRQALKKILNNPKKTDKVLTVIDTLVSDDESEEHTP